jgi:hypothetical protein
VTVEVRPANGLLFGPYSAILTITGTETTGSGGLFIEIPLSFVVVHSYDFTVSPEGHDFDSQYVGYPTVDEQTFTITNTGTGTYTNISASLDTTNFIITSDPSASLGPSGSVTVDVRPADGLSPGPYTATLTVTGTETTGSGGMFIEISLTFMVMHNYEVSMSHDSHDFGHAVVGYYGVQTHMFTMTNTGSGTVSGIQTSFENNYFAVASISGTSISAEGYITIYVSPIAGLPVGIYVDTMTITGYTGITEQITLMFEVTEHQPVMTVSWILLFAALLLFFVIAVARMAALYQKKE